MPQGCPLTYLGFWNGLYHYTAHVCGTTMNVHATDTRPHTIDFDCPNCTDPLGIGSFKAAQKDGDTLPTEHSDAVRANGLEEHVPAGNGKPGDSDVARGRFHARVGVTITNEQSPVLVTDKDGTKRAYRLLTLQVRDPLNPGDVLTLHVGQETTVSGGGDKQGAYLGDNVPAKDNNVGIIKFPPDKPEEKKYFVVTKKI